MASHTFYPPFKNSQMFYNSGSERQLLWCMSQDEVTTRKIKIVLCRWHFLLKAQMLKLSTWKDVQNCPDTNMKRKELSHVLKSKIMGTCKSEPTHQYHPKSWCQSMQIEHRGNIFIPTGNNTFWANSCSCISRQATDIFFTADQYLKGKQKWKSMLFP